MGLTDAADVTLVGDLLADSYERHADRPAVGDGNTVISYAELGSRARRLAAGLASTGCRRGDRIALISPNRPEWFEVDHACILGGYTRVGPITRLHPLEVAGILADAQPRVAVVESSWLRTAGRDWIPESVERVVEFGPEPGAVYELFPDAPDVTPPAAEREAATTLVYTSGSTGRPKGVIWTQRSLGALVRNVSAEMEALTAADVALHTAPLAHFSGAVAMGVFASGGCNLTLSSFDLERVVELLDSRQITVLPLVPTQITMLSEFLLKRAAAGRPVDVSAVRLVPYSGSAIAPDRLAIVQRLMGPVMLQFYGSTEAPLPLTALHPAEHAAALTPGRSGLLASAGRPTRYVTLAVVDPDGSPVPTGDTGEIVVGGDQVMPGYWRNADETAAVFDAQGRVRTGDVGYLDADGYLYLVDRKKDMVITGGFNVYPREVENVISTLAGVREVAVTGAPSQTWGEELVAVIARMDGSDVTTAQVFDHCRTRIAGYKVPKRVVFVDELPKNAAGKVAKKVIRDRLWTGHERRV